MYLGGTGHVGYGSRRSPRARPQNTPEDELFFYFFHIDERDASPDTFLSQWERIPDYDFTPKALSNILHKVAKYIRDGLEEPEGFYLHEQAIQLRNILIENWDIWEQEALARINKFEPISIDLIMTAHRMLGFKPTPRMQKAFGKFATDRAAFFDLSEIQIHFKEAAYLTTNVSSALTQRLRDKIKAGERLPGKGYNTDLIWSLAVIDSIFPRPEYKQIADMLRPQLVRTRSHSTLHKKRYDAARWFDWKLEGFKNPKQEEINSRHEKRLRTLFNKAGIKTTKMANPSAIPAFPKAVDFTVLADNALLHIEADGPTHFLSSLGSHAHLIDQYNPPYDGPTLFRSANMHKAAKNEHILRIPFPIADLMLGDGPDRKYNADTRQKISRFFVDAALRQAPGVYRTEIRSKSKPDKCPLGVVPLLPHRVNG